MKMFDDNLNDKKAIVFELYYLMSDRIDIKWQNR